MPLSLLSRLSSRVSAWNHRRRVARHQRKHSYPAWIAAYDTLSPAHLAELRQRSAELESGPTISVVIPALDPDPLWLSSVVSMLEQQTYGRWEICAGYRTPAAARIEQLRPHTQRLRLVALDGSEEPQKQLLDAVQGDLVTYLEAGTQLRPHALQLFAEAARRQPEAGLLYCDDDELDGQGNRCNPRFKPDWNLSLFRSCDLLSGLCLYRADALRRSGGWRSRYEHAAAYELSLRCSEGLSESGIVHLPWILYHRCVGPAGGREMQGVRHSIEAVQDHLARLKVEAHVQADGPGWRVSYALPRPAPTVELIVPTRDRLDLLRLCVSSVLDKTEYPQFRLTVVDNGSVEPSTLHYFEQLRHDSRVRVIHDPAPFNYSRLNNLAVAQSDADLVCLLNNDIEVITPTWLSEMVSQACQPGVGVVGARLWYPDDTLQHAGMVIGIGSFAGHVHKHFPRSSAGYLGRARLAQEFSSVTGACLLIHRSLYREVGGLNEQDLAVACNDVDLCLKVRAAGRRVVWTPYAELYHHESASRGNDDEAEKSARFGRELAYMRKHWVSVMRSDPAYNPNLTLKYEDFTLAFPPRMAWRRPGGTTANE